MKFSEIISFIEFSMFFFVCNDGGGNEEDDKDDNGDGETSNCCW